MQSIKTLLIVPAYHEGGKISKILPKVSEKIISEIYLVVDSPTESFLREINTTIEKTKVPVTLTVNSCRSGVGTAIRMGIEYAKARNFKIVAVMAGNGKDNPLELPRLINPIVKLDYDYVQGSRFLPGGSAIKNPFLRGVFSRLFPFIWTLTVKKRCTDVTNGFRAYKTSIFNNKQINLQQDWLKKYGLEYYIHYKVLTLGYLTTEVSVSKTYSHRHKGGFSKISPFRDWWDIVGPLILLKLNARK